ncbi:MAG: cytochrome c peroxidase [Gemmataceae bacterium]
MQSCRHAVVTAGLFALAVPGWLVADVPTPAAADNLEWQLPNERLIQPFESQVPVKFVTASSNPAEWEKLPKFWNDSTDTAVNPATGKSTTRKAVVIKVPLGLTTPPPVPTENPITVAKWTLGKQLYFDPILSTNSTVACASCHDPKLGYTDQSRFSKGIHGKLGGMSAPTVVNTAYNTHQFWDGRASSLEDQAQGPVGNNVEMFGGEGSAWDAAITRVRVKYAGRFEEVFGTPATRDNVVKAIAAYERTVLSGNSIHDRADLAAAIRAEKEGKAASVTAADFETVLKDLFAKKDAAPLQALLLSPEKDAGRIAETAKSLAAGRAIFFGKARCNSCHVGENFTDNAFHNLGVGVKNGEFPKGELGRFARMPLGHKDPEYVGAFKTPTLRHLLSTAPFMHDGSEANLEAVVDFYDRGGNANEFLDVKMRDIPTEQATISGKVDIKGVQYFGKSKKPIIPLKLGLTPQEKKDLVTYLRSLQGEAFDPIVADPSKLPVAVKK